MIINNIYKNLIYFVIAGSIVVVINNIALKINTTAAALLWSFPILSLPVFIFIYRETNDRKLLLNINSDIFIFFFVNLTFFIFIYYLTEFTQLTIPYIILLSLVLYLIIAIYVYYIIRKLKY